MSDHFVYFPSGRNPWQGLIDATDLSPEYGTQVSDELSLFDRPDAYHTFMRAAIQALSRGHYSWYRRFSDFDYLTTIRTAIISLGEVQSFLANVKAIPGGYNVGLLNMAFSNNILTLLQLFGPGGTFGEIMSSSDWLVHLFGGLPSISGLLGVVSGLFGEFETVPTNATATSIPFSTGSAAKIGGQSQICRVLWPIARSEELISTMEAKWAGGASSFWSVVLYADWGLSIPSGVTLDVRGRRGNRTPGPGDSVLAAWSTIGDKDYWDTIARTEGPDQWDSAVTSHHYPVFACGLGGSGHYLAGAELFNSIINGSESYITLAFLVTSDAHGYLSPDSWDGEIPYDSESSHVFTFVFSGPGLDPIYWSPFANTEIGASADMTVPMTPLAMTQIGAW